MSETANNQAIVDAIEKRIGAINNIYIMLASIILIMLLLAVIGYFSVSKTNAILEEFVTEVKLNSKDRTTTALMVQSFNNLEMRLSAFIDEQRKQNQNQKEFNDKHMVVLDDAKTYINQNPIELLRQGK